MSKIKNGGLDQYGAGLFERQQFGTAGVERVKHRLIEKDAKGSAPKCVEASVIVSKIFKFRLS